MLNKLLANAKGDTDPLLRSLDCSHLLEVCVCQNRLRCWNKLEHDIGVCVVRVLVHDRMRVNRSELARDRGSECVRSEV